VLLAVAFAGVVLSLVVRSGVTAGVFGGLAVVSLVALVGFGMDNNALRRYQQSLTPTYSPSQTHC
jgi:hypothetical protein